MDFTVFKKHLKELLVQRGITQKDLALSIGMAPETFSRYFSGVRTPDLKYIVAMAAYFNVSIDWLLGVSSNRYGRLEDESKALIALYTRATELDRQVIKLVLSKYSVAE